MFRMMLRQPVPMQAARAVSRPVAMVHATLRSPGQPLDRETRACFEASYGRDLSGVRVHTDARAAASARAIGAQAYTIGSAIAFGEGRYRPQTTEGRQLLAHELAHVAQQRRATGAGFRIGETSDTAEHEADAAAAQALQGRGPVALAAADTAPVLRRTKVETWGGWFDNDGKYAKSVKHDDEQKNGSYGLDAIIRFTPKSVVQAEKVALVQTSNTQIDGRSIYIGQEAESKEKEKRSTEGGTHIDQRDLTGRTPLVGMKVGPTDKNLSDSVPMDADTVTYGTPSASEKADRVAAMGDPPRAQVGDGSEASQTLETAALAVSGPQKGAYYGSVTWGWHKKAGAKDVELMTLSPARAPVAGSTLAGNAPSGEFGDASTLWNRSKTNTGADRLALPVATSKFVVHPSTPLMEHAGKGKTLAVLPFKTEVQITTGDGPGDKDWSFVLVTSGSYAGKQGWIKTGFLGDFLPKKPI